MDVPLGDGTLSFELPDRDVTVCEPPGHDHIDVGAAGDRTMVDPHGPPHGDLERAGVFREQVTVVVGRAERAPVLSGGWPTLPT